MSISAVLWDYDGTIVNSMVKHFIVNVEVFKRIEPDLTKENWPSALTSLEEYKKAESLAINWRDLYKTHFGFTKEQIDAAGNLWGKLINENPTPIDIFEGINDVMQKLHFVPHGICSQNCSKNIKNTLKKFEVEHHFTSIIGYNDISFEKQKPDPEGFIYCLDQMQIPLEGILFYVGDHQEDVRFAKNAEIALRQRGYSLQIFSIAACYGSRDIKHWDLKPDFEAHKTSDIADIILNSDLVKNLL